MAKIKDLQRRVKATIRMSHNLNCKNKKKVILHGTTLTFWRCVAE